MWPWGEDQSLLASDFTEEKRELERQYVVLHLYSSERSKWRRLKEILHPVVCPHLLARLLCKESLFSVCCFAGWESPETDRCTHLHSQGCVLSPVWWTSYFALRLWIRIQFFYFYTSTSLLKYIYIWVGYWIEVCNVNETKSVHGR